MCADTGYDNSEFYDAMLKRGMKKYIPRRSKPTEKTNYEEEFSSDKFEYDISKNIYNCPAGKDRHYSDYKKGICYKRYSAKKCIGKGNHSRRIQRNMHEKARNEQSKNIGTAEYFEAMR